MQCKGKYCTDPIVKTGQLDFQSVVDVQFCLFFFFPSQSKTFNSLNSLEKLLI